MPRQYFDIGLTTDFMVAKPDPPVRADAVDALRTALSGLRGLTEAHLVLCHIPGVSRAPALVLTLVLEPNTRAEAVMDLLGPRLGKIIPRNEFLDVWPLLASHPGLPSIRAADCRIW
jgi:hypothetical protein